MAAGGGGGEATIHDDDKISGKSVGLAIITKPKQKNASLRNSFFKPQEEAIYVLKLRTQRPQSANHKHAWDPDTCYLMSLLTQTTTLPCSIC